MSKFKSLLAAAFGIVTLVFCGNYLYERYQEIQQIEFQINYFLIALALAFNCLYYLLLDDSWQRIVRLFSGDAFPIPRPVLDRIFFVSFVSRYLPVGQLFVHGGRVEWLYRQGRSRTIGVTSIIYEQTYMLGGVLLLTGLGIWFYPIAMLPDNFLLSKSALTVLAFLFSSTCFLLPELILLLFSRLQRRNTEFAPLQKLARYQKLDLMLRFVLNNILQGVAAYLTLAAILLPHTGSFVEAILVVSAYPISRLAGQLIVFVPSGLGVREGVFVFLVGQLFPLPSVLLCAALMRLLGMAMELLLAGIFTIIIRDTNRSVGSEDR